MPRPEPEDRDLAVTGIGAGLPIGVAADEDEAPESEFVNIFDVSKHREFTSGVMDMGDDDSLSARSDRMSFYDILDALDGANNRYEFFGFFLNAQQIRLVMENVGADIRQELAQARARGDQTEVARLEAEQRALTTYDTIVRTQGPEAGQAFLRQNPSLAGRVQREAAVVAAAPPPHNIIPGPVDSDRPLTIREQQEAFRRSQGVWISEQDQRRLRESWEQACRVGQSCAVTFGREAQRLYDEHRPGVERFVAEKCDEAAACVADSIDRARPVVDTAIREGGRIASECLDNIRDAACKAGATTFADLQDSMEETFGTGRRQAGSGQRRERQQREEPPLRQNFDTVVREAGEAADTVARVARDTTDTVVREGGRMINDTVAAVRRIDWNPFD